MQGAEELPRNAVAFLMHFARRRWFPAGALALVLVAGSAATVATQYALKMLIDALTAQHHVLPMLAVSLLLGFMLTESVAFRAGGWLGSRLVIGLGVDIRGELFARLTARPWRFFHHHQSSALAGRIGAAGQSATAAVSTLIWNVIPPAADLVGSIVVLAAIDWRLALGLVAAAILFTWLLHRWGGQGFEVHQAYYRDSAEVMGDLGDVLANIMLVKSFGSAGRERARLDHRLAHEATLHGRSWMFLERLRLMHDAAFWLIAACLLLLALVAWQRGRLSTGDVVVVMTLSLRVVNGSRELALALLGFTRQLGAVSEVAQLLVESEAAPPRPYVLRAARGHIVLHDVWFAPDGRRPLFRGLSMDIPPGQKVGIAGPSGAGKSTLLRLIEGLVTPDRGEILIDDQALRQVTEPSLAAALAVVTQEVELLHRSLRENVAYGRPDASPREIEVALRAAGCEGFVNTLQGGLDAIVGERGVMLSGGQRQRLALARALLKHAPIVLLDEATSALDSATELAIQSALLEHAAGRTIVAVAHRLSTIMGFDRVIVLRHGAVVQDGNPRQMRTAPGPFAEMWAMQSRAEARGRAASA